MPVSSAVSSEDINFLVYRYLQESGFVHSAFTFSNESLVLKSSVSVTLAEHVPPGALISVVQKGLLYLQVETQVDTAYSKLGNEGGSGSESKSGMSKPSFWKTLAQTQSVQYSRWSLKYDKNRDDENEDERIATNEPEAKRHRQAGLNAEQPDDSQKKADTETSSRKSDEEGQVPRDASPHEAVQQARIGDHSRDATQLEHSAEGNVSGKMIENVASKQMNNDAASLVHHSSHSNAIADLNHRALNESVTHSLEDVFSLPGHTAEVFCCAWHPYDEILASGSGDSTVRLWDLTSRATATALPNCQVLECTTYTQDASSEDRDVTTLEWSSNGHLLATGCMDGVARLWSRDGLLQHSLSAHSESIFSLRFDDFGERILTGSYDKCVALWDVKTGQLHTKFEAHTAQVLDVDWKHGKRSDGDFLCGTSGESTTEVDIFASCSTDSTIAVYSYPCNEALGESECLLDMQNSDHGHVGIEMSGAFQSDVSNVDECSGGQTQKRLATKNAFVFGRQVQILKGHTDEVNAIRWDPSGQLLASCSDDKSVLLWQLGGLHPIKRLCEHREEIYTLRWSPTGPGTNNPSAYLRLASASFDASVKIWDADAGACVCTLKKHDKKVYTISFSPSGDLIASGSLGGQVNVWSVRNGTLVKTFFAHQRDSSLSDSANLPFMGASPSKSVTSSTDIFEVAWNSTGTRLAATSTNAVTVIDLMK